MATEKGVKVANAVVSVIPSFEGARQAIGSEIPAMVGAASEKGGEVGGKKLGGKLTEGISTAKVAIGNAIGNILTSAIQSVSGLVKDTLSSAFNNYGDYQQLVGGVETLFKGSAGAVQQYAANAYKTAGLSANEYMENVTGFSASLIQSLGGDTEKAARIADVAMTDMSDNANKMGTAMDSLTFAYQGFAKGNYTMLDNLKLGYGGTKTEMQRLLTDAQNLKAAQGEMAEYSIDSFSDIVEAIHVVQDNLDITGTTAKEAGDTIQGSIGMAKSAWENFLTGLADPDADMKQLSKNLVESFQSVIKNVAPAIKQMFAGAFEGITDMLDEIGLSGVSNFMRNLKAGLENPAFQQAVGMMIDAVKSLLDVLGQAGGIFEQIFSTVSTVLGNLFAGLSEALYSDVFLEMLDAIGQLIGDIAGTVGDMFGQLAPDSITFADVLRMIFAVIRDIFNIAKQVWDFISPVLTALADIATTVFGAIWEILQAIGEVISEVGAAMMNEMEPGFEKLGEISLTDVANGIKNIVGFVKDLVLNILGWIKDNAPAIGEVLGKIGNVVMEVISVIGPLLSAIFDFIFDAINGLVDFFTNDPIGQAIVSVLGGIFDIIGKVIGGIADLLSWIFGLFGDSLEDADKKGQNIFYALGEFIVRLVSGIADFFGKILGDIGKAIQDTVGNILKVIGDTIGSIAKGIQDAVIGFCDFIVRSIFNMVDTVIGIAQGIVDFFASIPQKIIDFFTGIPDAIAGVFKNIHIPTFHVDGEFNLDPLNFKLPSISFYKKGGFVGNPTLLNVAGEAGTEVVLSEQGRFTNRFAQMIADNLENLGRGDTYFVIDGAVVNSDAEMERNFYDCMMEIKRKAGQYV